MSRARTGWCYIHERAHDPDGWGEGCIDSSLVTESVPVAWWRYLRAVAAEKSYLIRPYDPIADRRRWRWQRPTPCGRQVWEAAPQPVKDTLADMLARRTDDQHDDHLGK